ncbi:MAG: class I SAM-dependent RNA methyltransferase [Firmicutes bacterium]|nr:class I SAM-dependent RNA methyltransferase [Bacillota bacterium]
MDKKYRLMATTTFGLEAVVKREIIDLGYENISVSDGYVEYDGNEEDIARSNLWLRAADKVLIVLNKFQAKTFEQLFDGVYSINWQELLDKDANFIITGKSIKSVLSSVPACQSVAEKAVIKKLQTVYDIEHFPKSGAEYTIQVALLKDTVTITLNTSGPSLHKRGYRVAQVLAPIKETMAAALIELSFWKKNRVFLDPCCGSGTICIEAALIARNIAPGLFRKFAAEEWKFIDKNTWKQQRSTARAEIDVHCDPMIYGSDINERAIEISKRNAENAGVDDCIKFEQIPVNKLKLPGIYGVCISNPPYAERMGNVDDVERLYRDLGKIFRNNKTWSAYFITSYEGFEKLYGQKADKKRKLFNGNVKTDYYQFYGERPSII